MDEEKLKKYLEELKTEIDSLEKNDGEAADRLRKLMNSIEESVGAPDDQRRNDDLVLGIQNSIEQFETEHPVITGILDRITNVLSSMGI